MIMELREHRGVGVVRRSQSSVLTQAFGRKPILPVEVKDYIITCSNEYKHSPTKIRNQKSKLYVFLGILDQKCRFL